MSQTHTTRRPWLPFVVVGGAVIGLMVFFSLVSSPDNAPPRQSPTFSLMGELRLNSAGSTVTGSTCTGEGGYSDIRAGAQVAVFDANGAVVGHSALQGGVHEPEACVFQFGVSVPRGEGTYQVEVSHRGKMVVTEEAAALGLTSLTLG